MNEDKPEIATGTVAKPEQQPADTKPATKPATAPAKVKAIKKAAKKVAPKAQAKKSVKKAKVAKPSAKSKGKAKAAKPKTSKPAKKNGKAAKNVPSKFPRHAKNPFRVGSSYGAIFDAFVRKPNGIRRDELNKLAMEATGKDAKHAAYDLAVILSAKESNQAPRHPSCREGYWVRRENDHLTIVID